LRVHERTPRNIYTRGHFTPQYLASFKPFFAYPVKQPWDIILLPGFMDCPRVFSWLCRFPGQGQGSAQGPSDPYSTSPLTKRPANGTMSRRVLAHFADVPSHVGKAPGFSVCCRRRTN